MMVRMFVTIDNNDKKKLARIAKEKQVSMSTVMRTAILKYIKKWEKKNERNN